MKWSRRRISDNSFINLPSSRQRTSSTTSSCFVLLFLLTVLLLLLNVEVPPFLVSWAIAFSYMCFCIWEVPVSVFIRKIPKCQVVASFKNVTHREQPSQREGYCGFIQQPKCLNLSAVGINRVINGPAPRTQERKVCCSPKSMESRRRFSAPGSNAWSWARTAVRSTAALVISTLLLHPPFSSGSTQLNPLSPASTG